MKRIILTAIVSLFAISAIAQVSNEDLAIIQAKFKKDKKELIKQAMQLSDAQGQAFWPIYDEYETKRQELSATRAGIINDYLKKYNTLTDEEATDLVKRTLENDSENTKLQKTYLKKIEGVVGGKNAAKFYQLESYLQSNIRMSVQDNIPFIGELKAKQ